MNIVITGEGIISAIGYDKATVLAALREKRTGIGQMRWLKSTHRELPVGEVKWSDEELQQQLGQDRVILGLSGGGPCVRRWRMPP